MESRWRDVECRRVIPSEWSLGFEFSKPLRVLFFLLKFFDFDSDILPSYVIESYNIIRRLSFFRWRWRHAIETTWYADVIIVM